MAPAHEKIEAAARAIEGSAVDETVRVDEKVLARAVSESEQDNQKEDVQNQDQDGDKIPEKEGVKLSEAGKDAEMPVCWDDCDFETAITATGYGKYNYMILAMAVFPMLSCLSTTSTISFILPSAECELRLTSFHKGMLNACVYIGCILSAFLWGFLSDTLGRQKLLVITFALDGLLNLTAALAQNFEVLLSAKLLAGFICAGPFAILMTYLAECHSAQHRASIIQWTGVFSALGTVALPMLAWVIIPRPWSYTVLSLYLPSWRIFLIVCTIPSIVSAIILYFQFESPKFLMTQGRTEEAMAAFQSIYAANSGQPKSTFPVQSLINEKKIREKLANTEESDEPKTMKEFLSSGWQQVSPLFHPPHLKNAILVFTFQGCCLLGLCIRLWMPQLFSSVLSNGDRAENATSVCELLAAPSSSDEPPAGVVLDCADRHVDAQVYINSIVIGIVTAVSYLLSGYLIKLLGKKWLMMGCIVVSVLACCGMYWATSSNLLLFMSSILVSFVSVATTAIIAVAVDLFPTTLRTVAVSLTMMVGRGGAMIGNLIFPVLLDWNCAVPFFLFAAIISGAGLITFFIPKTKGKALE